jgi:hypothetical protein
VVPAERLDLTREPLCLHSALRFGEKHLHNKEYSVPEPHEPSRSNRRPGERCATWLVEVPGLIRYQMPEVWSRPTRAITDAQGAHLRYRLGPGVVGQIDG